MKQHKPVTLRNKGFTLLEVMIALVIFGISALVILEQTSRSVLQQSQLEEKTLALWVAENQLASLRLQTAWPNTGTSEQIVTSAQRDWTIQQSVDETANPLLRKITLNVFQQGRDTPIVTMSGFMGEH